MTQMPEPKPPAPQPALPVLIANFRAADRIEIMRGTRVLWLERRGQAWGLAQAGGYPARPDAIDALIDGLQHLTLDHVVPGPPSALGVADPMAAAGAGTLVRVLSVSGAVLGAIIVGPASGLPYVRRPNAFDSWLANARVPASPDRADWIDTHLPPPDMAHMTVLEGDGTDEAALRQALGSLSFADVRAGPQIQPAPLRQVRLGLPDGTAFLMLGRLDGQDWLKITGSSAWARRLSPYAFAVSEGVLP